MSTTRNNPLVLLMVAVVLAYSAISSERLLTENKQLAYDLTACEAVNLEWKE